VKIVAVFHGAKVEGLKGKPAEIGANPPMTVDGMEKILQLIPAIRAEGPFDGAYCSRLARACDAASVLAIELNLNFQMVAELGQHGNKDGGNVIMYPGHEGEDMVTWQSDGLAAIKKLWENGGHDSTYLVVSHRPIIAGLVGHAINAHTLDELNRIVSDPNLTARGFVVFAVQPGGKIGVVG
jgi:broad specificity phosphatase PhoE